MGGSAGLARTVATSSFEMSFIDETDAKRREPLPSCWDVPFERLETLADVFAYAAAEGVTLRIDGTEVQVRRPRANRTGRKAFVSGNKKQNTMKPTVVGDGDGRMLWAGATRPGRMHDATAVRTEGIQDLLRCHPQVNAEVDSGHQAWPATSPTRSARRRQNPPRTPRPSRWPPTSGPANSSRRGGSASNTRSLNPSSAVAATLHRPPRILRQDLPGHRRAGLRPHRPALIGARISRRTLQASTPQPQSRTNP
jgi:DDE superfamily endonuclease